MGAVYHVEILPPTTRAYYPHMAKNDAAVWNRFLLKHGADFMGFAYDVALGGRVIDAPAATDRERLAWQYVTALKIDAVGYKQASVWILEVRPDATVSAFGSAFCYALVAQREQLAELPLIPAVVCETMQVDVRWCCQRAGIEVFEV